MTSKIFWIGGKQNVASLLDSDENYLQILIDQSRKDTEKYKKFKKINFVSKKTIDLKFSKFPSYMHQGFAALVNYKKIFEVNDLIEKNYFDNVLAIDQVKDIGNIGTIIRSCVSFGVKAILLNKNNLTKNLSLVFKNSSGSFKNIHVSYSTNIFNELKKFSKNNYSIISLDGQGNEDLNRFFWSKKNLIILGSENKGIRKNILKKSDHVIKIKIEDKVESLNVAQASSICLYDLYSKTILNS